MIEDVRERPSEFLARVITDPAEVKLPGADRWPNWIYWVYILCGLPFFFVLVSFDGNSFQGIAASLSVGVICVNTVVMWNLRKFATFWLLLLISLAFHTALIFSLPNIDTHFAGMIFAPLVIVDIVFWQFLTTKAIRALKF